MNIAILDFDLGHANSVCQILEGMGHSCCAFSASAALVRRLQQEPCDLLVVNLQDVKEEPHVIRTVRPHLSAKVPILCIIGSFDEDEILACLAAGANDYLFRPIRSRDLITRILVLLRQAYPSQAEGGRSQFGAFVFESRRGRLTKNGKPMNLTRKEFDLALLFFRHLGRPLSRATIIETVWAMDPPTLSRTMDTHVSRVRNKLGLIPAQGFRLAPVYGYGYRLEQIMSHDGSHQENGSAVSPPSA
jgi:DNA-binding response OmpR family regulator